MSIYISLTSIYDNQKNLCKTLESIKKQTVLPKKCYIFLSEEPYLMDKGFKDKKITNETLKKLLRDKLFEIKWVKNTGPFRKLIPLLKEKWNEDCFIITVDDDVYYHHKLVEIFMKDYKKSPYCVSYRSWDVGNSLKNINYQKRVMIEKPKLNIYNFPTGKGSILYKPSFFHKTGDLIFREDLFMKLCPTADDVWFYLLRILNKINCYALQRKSIVKEFKERKRALFDNYNKKVVNNVDKNTMYIRDTIEELEKLKYKF